MLETSATDDVIAKTDAEIMKFTQPFNLTPIEDAELHRAKTLRCSRVPDEYVLNINHIEGLQDFIRQSMRSSGSSNKHETLQDLARLAPSLSNLRNGARLEEGLHNSGKPRKRRDSRSSQEAAAMHLYTDETLTLPSSVIQHADKQTRDEDATCQTSRKFHFEKCGKRIRNRCILRQ